MHSAEQQEAWELVEQMDDRQLKSEVVDLRSEVLTLKIEVADDAIALRDMMRERDAAEAELAAERARLDWLEDNSVCYHVCIDRQPDGYSIHNSPPSPGSVRAAIDAAMKEGAK
jgi:hypothetical protein